MASPVAVVEAVEAGGRNATDEVINSALRYRVQAPMIDELLADLGIEGGNLSKQPGLIREASDMQRIAQALKQQAAERHGGTDDEDSGEGGGGTSDDGSTNGERN